MFRKVREPKELRSTGDPKLYCPHSKLLVGEVSASVFVFPLLVPSVGTDKESGQKARSKWLEEEEDRP